VALVAAAAVLAAAWLGPLPSLAGSAFTAHMVLHMTVVAVAAPLLAVGVAGGALDPVRGAPGLFAPIPASLAELVVVWGWHAPALHHAARSSPGVMIAEQGSFFVTGVVVWLAAYGGAEAARRERALGGMVGLLLTSMHMTLLGALLGLADRDLYDGSASGVWGLTALEDQQLGGAVMLLVGGAVYLAGGVGLARRLLREPRTQGAGV
jgi:putative membrane protein